MKSFKIILVYTLLVSLSGLSKASSQDAAEILKKMDYLIFAPKDKIATVEIITYKGTQEDKVREAVMKQKGADKKIYRYTKPESQAGISTLSLPGDIMWMKMPAFDKPKKISLLAKSQAFNNTDFAWEDIPNQPYLERFDPKYIGTEGNSFILELTPKSDKSNYSKIVVYIDKTNYFPARMDYYDKKGSKEKEGTYTYSKVGQYWNASEVTMTDLKKNTSTRITMKDVKFDVGISDEEFTEEKFWQ